MTTPREPNWSAEDFNTLKKMAAEGKRPDEIAVAVKRTRNAVIGKGHRNGISFIQIRHDIRARARQQQLEQPAADEPRNP